MAGRCISRPPVGVSDPRKGEQNHKLIIFLLVGLIAGALASYILGRQINLLIGIIGEIIIATIGAIMCIVVWQRIR